MRYWGKVMALILALVSGIGFWGLVMLLFVGHLLDCSSLAKGRAFITKQQKQFLQITFAVMGHLAKMKGRITELDIQIATKQMVHMQLNGKMRTLAQNAYRAGKKADYPLWYNLSQFRHGNAVNDDLLRTFLEIQLGVAFADGEPTSRMSHMLYSIAQALGISRSEYDALLNRRRSGKTFNDAGGRQGHTDKEHTQPPLNEFTIERAYLVLGVTRNDDAATIKRAYRKLMSLHHPDKVAARGLSPHHQKRAKQKSQEIQAAWGVLKRARGFK